MEISKWKREIILQRKQKDMFFAEHFQSPIPIEYRRQFRGLNYFSPKPDYYFELELHEHPQKQMLKIEDTQGNVRSFIRWGEFNFKIENKECKLQAYKSEASEEGLFIPFRDATSGKQTYGAGRYLDLRPEDHLKSEGKWIVDFNKAYNPWCAYNDNYACPFVPPENWLQVEILAGEKNYSLDNR